MNNSSKAFEGILDRYFEKLLQAAPTFATSYAGLRSGEGKLGSASLRFHQKRQLSRASALKALEHISPRDLSDEQQLDRLALRSLLLNETEDFDRGRHTLEPNAPERVFSILLHELMRGDDEAARAATNIRSLLRQVPGFLEEAAQAIHNPEPVWLRVMEQTVEGSRALFDGLKTFLESHGAKPADASVLASAQKALGSYAEGIKRNDKAPEGSFALGASALQRRVRDELGLDYTLGQVETLALNEIGRISELLRAASKRFDPKRPANEVLARLRSEWTPARPLLELYREETTRVAHAFKRAKAVSFPAGDELRIKAVPEFLRPLIPTAAYTAPGAFQKRQRGVFWVNDPGLAQRSKTDLAAEQRQHFGVSLTCAHEGYPGHHLQFVTANRHPRKWRRLFAHAIFYEGWTLWCEQMMVDLKIERSPALQLQQLHDALWRCNRILVDLRLQTGRYSYEQAVAHMRKHLGFTTARARADVNWYTASPGVPMSYWLGRLENERLRRRLVLGRGWSLRQFNDWLLGFGTIPQSWIEKYALN